MDAPFPLAGLRFSISGSAGDTTAGPIDRELLRRCHAFVGHLTTAILRAGGEIVLFVGREPRLVDDDPQTAQVFSWTELQAIAEYCPHRATTHSGRHLAHAVATADPLKPRIPPQRQALWQQLLDQDGVLSLTPIVERNNTGGHQRERQAEQADVLITLGGGKGVFDMDRQCRERGCLILPLDPRIGSSCNDGEASPELNREALERPERFAPAEHAAWFAGQLPRLSFYGGAGSEELAMRVLQVILRLAPPAPQRGIPAQPHLDSASISPSIEATPNLRPALRSALPDKIHFLVLSDEWWPFKGGISTFNRDFCLALAGAGHSISLYIPRRALTDTEKEEIRQISGITLVETSSKSVAPEHELFSPPLLSGRPDVIVGHSAVTGPMARFQRDQFFNKSLLVHFIHVSPMDVEYEKGKDIEDAMRDSQDKDEAQAELAAASNLVVAIGPSLESSILQSLKRREKKAQVHQLLPWLQACSLSDPPIQQACLFIGRAGAFHLKGLRIAAGAVDRLGERSILYVRGATKSDARDLDRRLKEYSTGRLVPRLQEYTTDKVRLNASFHDATIVLMPSRTEGFGLVGMEAIMRGIPFVASAESGLAEVLREYGGALGSAAVVSFLATDNDDTENIHRLHERLVPIWENPERGFTNARKLLDLLRPHLDEKKSISEFMQKLRAISR